MARTDQPHKLTFDAFVEKVADPANPLNAKHANLDYSRPETRAAWNGSKSKIPIWCNTCGTFFVQQAANHMALGQGCPPCGFALRTVKRTKKDPIADFRKVHGDLYDYSAVEYVNTHVHVEIICRAHGPFRQQPLNHLQGGGCPSCWENKRIALGAARTADYVSSYAERAARIHNGAYAILKPPAHSHDTVLLHCPKHGEFEQKAHVHLLGHGCYACGIHASQGQMEIAGLAESLGLVVEQDNRTILAGMHIDVWVPEKRLGIEYHGSIWHTKARVGGKHREKWERAREAGVRLIQIFDFEWSERREASQNRIAALLGGGNSVGARSCGLSPLSSKEANAFFARFHTQGAATKSVLAYGLWCDGELVAAASFGSGRYGAHEWELLRYASRGRVPGGFARLLNAFVSEHLPSTIVSYCDLRWGDGAVYQHNGFTLDGITEPDYWYWKKDKRVSRYAAQHRPKGQTEREWAAEQGYDKVLGVGHQRWLWTRPPS